MMESDPPKFYNVIDAEANKCPGASFKKPSFLDAVSLGHMYWDQTPEDFRPVRESNYLLISQNGAITRFHQDFSSTSVLYYLAKGLYYCILYSTIKKSGKNVKHLLIYQLLLQELKSSIL